MAKVLVLILVVIAVATMLVLVMECTAAVDRSISETDFYIRKALDGVVAAAPPAKESETRVATFKQTMNAASALKKANATGDEKQVVAVTAAFKMAADAVLVAASANKFKVMEENFEAAMLAPVSKCAADVDRCTKKTDSSVRKALDGVIAAALPTKKLETEEALFKQNLVAASALLKAVATGDKSQVVGLTIAYGMAANVVLGAAPADKFTVMEETFKAAVGLYA